MAVGVDQSRYHSCAGEIVMRRAGRRGIGDRVQISHRDDAPALDQYRLGHAIAIINGQDWPAVVDGW